MFWEQGLGGRLLLRFDCLGGEGGVEFLGGLCGYGGSSFGLEGSGMFLLGNRSLLSINHCHRFESSASASQ